MLTETEKQELARMKQQGYSFGEAMAELTASESSTPTPQPSNPSVNIVRDVELGTNVTGFNDKSVRAVEEQEPGGFFSNLRDRVRDIPSDIKETFTGAKEQVTESVQEGADVLTDMREQEMNPIRGGTRLAGDVAGGITGALGEIVIGLGKLALTPDEERAVRDTVIDIAQSEPVQNTIELGQKVIDRVPLSDAAKEDITSLFQAGALPFELTGSGATVRSAGRAANSASKQIGNLPKVLENNQKVQNLFKRNEDNVSEAIQNMNRKKDGARESRPDIEGEGIKDKALDAAVGAAGAVAQTYRKLVDSSKTRLVENLDRKALRDNINAPLDQVDRNIQDMYVNAVSPGVRGKKKTLAAIQANKQSASNAIKDITINKDNIEFRDIETQDIVRGETPSNLWEFGEAVSARKSQIYNDVLDQIGRAADEPIDTSRIVNQMDEIINSNVYKAVPSVINRAEQTKELFTTTPYTPKDIEELIKLYNESLQTFYRGGGTQGDAVVSALVANNLRDLLDEAVKKADGNGIKDLKRQYGDYKAIEQDVVHRALHNDQAREAGLVDMFGIRTVGDLSRGLAGDVGALRQGAGQIVGEGFIEALNDRDAMINRIFKVSEQAYRPTE